MTNQLTIIKNELTKPDTQKELAIALGINPSDETAINQAAKYAYGVYATIEASVGTNQDLSGCDPNSIKATMIEAANRRVYIDGRQHAHLVKYNNKCTFQMGYRGYLAKIKECYPDADFVVEPVYQGDTVRIWNEDGIQRYRHEKAGAFRSGEKDFIGILFAVTYTDNGRLIQKVADVPRERIERAKDAAKQKYIWTSDYVEKAKAAAVKNACKHLFASLQGLQAVVEYDNRHNYDPNQTIESATPARKTILDNINETVGKGGTQTPPAQTVDDDGVIDQPAQEYKPTSMYNDIIDVEFEDQSSAPLQATQSQQELMAVGEKKAAAGYYDYKAWTQALDDSQKDLVRHKHKDWSEKAKEVTRATQAASETVQVNSQLEPKHGCLDTEQPPI